MSTREAGRQIVTNLVQRFQANRADYMRPASRYNETQLRNDFLNDLLLALGWDVHNHANAPQRLREVLVEESVAVADADRTLQKKPDYTLRASDARKFFVEAKKPSVPVLTAPDPAFQVRRYGWNAGMAVSVLTNFDHLVLYDCRLRPQPDDNVSVSRLKSYAYTELVARFDELYDELSREAVYSGRFDATFGADLPRAGTEPFDRYFLRQIEGWREQLARSLAAANMTLGEQELNFLVQRLINRIVFLRICEDRERSRYEALKGVQTYVQLKALFHEADRRYNSGLFDFIEDTLSLRVEVESDVLLAIFAELYFPKSAYDFSVVEAGVLGDIYEQFLAREIALGADRAVGVVEKPEVVQSDGVVTTPKYIVDRLVAQALAPMCQGKTQQELASLRVADIACGSGVFLAAAFQFLLDWHLEWYVANGAQNHLDQLRATGDGQYQLTLAEKQRILTSAIYGADIDIQAVEIARFSLMLKVLEGESAATIDLHLQRTGKRALPNLGRNVQCGNSLVDSGYYGYTQGAANDATQLVAVNPFDWRHAFPAVMGAGGFDVILGNPPYIRIQNMVRYAPREVGYYRSPQAGYATAQSDNFDKYALFVERALALLKPGGTLGYIVPHKFATTRAGAALRRLLANSRALALIVHFGVLQVFPGRSTYTCLLVLGDRDNPDFAVEHVEDLRAWRYGQPGAIQSFAKDTIDEAPWVFLPPATERLFERWRTARATRRLGDVADIFVGVQTSNDRVYILRSTSEAEDIVKFQDAQGTARSIERAVLRPCLLDAPVPPFGTPQPNRYILFPYRIEGGRAVLYTVEQMQRQFPLAWAYLAAHQEALAQRNLSNRTDANWFQYGRAQSLARFPGEPKLLWPVLSTEPRYAYDAQDIVFTGGGNGPYYALRAKPGERLSLHFLQAVLSHPVSELMVRARASVFRGGYVSHGKQFLADVPVRALDLDAPADRAAHDAITTMAQQLTRVAELARVAQVPHLRAVAERQAADLRRQLNALVERLYDMQPADRALLDALTAAPDPSDT